jgi:uncharacterized protein (TIGR02265 family)
MSDIRGLIIQSRLEYIESMENGTMHSRILHKLNDPVKNAVGEQVFLTNLYPFHLLKDLDNAIGESLDIPLESIFRDIGQRTAPLLMNRYFFNYTQARNPHGFLAQLARLYPYLWNFGKYFYSKSDDEGATVQLVYDEDIHKPYCWFMQSLLQKGVEICGVTGANVREIQCEAEDGESCTYHLSWKEK